MEITYLIYQAIKKRLEEKLPELPIGWHAGQESAHNYHPKKSAYVGFARIPTKAYASKIQQCDISFYVMLVTSVKTTVNDIAVERHSVESTLIYRALESFSSNYAYILGSEHDLAVQQLFSSVHRTQVNTAHNWTNAIVSQISFRCLAYDFSAMNDYILTSLTPTVSGEYKT